jgi:hypothetical protein
LSLAGKYKLHAFIHRHFVDTAEIAEQEKKAIADNWPKDNSPQCCQMVHIFSYQKSQFWYILKSLGIENGTFYVHLVHFVVHWYILPVSVCCTRKIWQPCFADFMYTSNATDIFSNWSKTKSLS